MTSQTGTNIATSNYMYATYYRNGTVFPISNIYQYNGVTNNVLLNRALDSWITDMTFIVAPGADKCVTTETLGNITYYCVC